MNPGCDFGEKLSRPSGFQNCMAEGDRFARRIALKVKEEKLHEFLSLTRRDISPILVKEKGLRRLYLIRSVENMNEFFALTLWNSKRDADNYEKSGRYAKNLRKIRALLEGEPNLSQYHVELHRVGGSVAKRVRKRARS